LQINSDIATRIQGANTALGGQSAKSKQDMSSYIDAVAGHVLMEMENILSQRNRWRHKRRADSVEEGEINGSLHDLIAQRHGNQRDDGAEEQESNIPYDISSMSLGLLIEILIGLFTLKDVEENQKSILINHMNTIVDRAITSKNEAFSRDTMRFVQKCVIDVSSHPDVASEDVLFLNSLLEVPTKA